MQALSYFRIVGSGQSRFSRVYNHQLLRLFERRNRSRRVTLAVEAGCWLLTERFSLMALCLTCVGILPIAIATVLKNGVGGSTLVEFVLMTWTGPVKVAQVLRGFLRLDTRLFCHILASDFASSLRTSTCLIEVSLVGKFAFDVIFVVKIEVCPR